MKYTPRKAEVEAVVSILESDEFDSPEHMAKAVLRAAAEQLQQRDWTALAHFWGSEPSGLNFGPFGSPSEAEAFAAKLAAGGEGRVVKLTSPAGVTDLIDGKKGADFCADEQCSHAAFMHLMDGTSRGKCALDGCRCRGWAK